MNDKELADKVVALGVGRIADSVMGCIPGFVIDNAWMSLSAVGQDWRVAGALIIKCLSQGYRIDLRLLGVRITTHSPTLITAATTRSVDQVPAIIEACVKALERVCQERDRNTIT